MLVIGLFIGMIVGFYNFARDNNLNKVLWAILPLPVYFGSQFIAGLIVGALNPSLLSSEVSILILGFSSGILGVVILYLIMRNEAKKNKNKTLKMNSDILDDEI